MVTILDNVLMYIKLQRKVLIEVAGHLVCVLPPCSSVFNPTGLTLRVIKAWIRLNYCFVQTSYNRFDELLRASTTRGSCNCFDIKHASCVADGLNRMDSNTLRGKRRSSSLRVRQPLPLIFRVSNYII